MVSTRSRALNRHFPGDTFLDGWIEECAVSEAALVAEHAFPSFPARLEVVGNVAAAHHKSGSEIPKALLSDVGTACWEVSMDLRLLVEDEHKDDSAPFTIGNDDGWSWEFHRLRDVVWAASVLLPGLAEPLIGLLGKIDKIKYEEDSARARAR